MFTKGNFSRPEKSLNIKLQTKLFLVRCEIFRKFIYTFRYRYVLASRPFSKAKIFFGMRRVPTGFKIPFLPMENVYFYNLVHYVEFEI